MADTEIVLMLLLRGFALCGLLLIGLAMLRSGASLAARLSGAAAMASLGACSIVASPATRDLIAPPYDVLSWCVASGVTAYIWMFVLAVFEDRRMRLPMVVPAIVLTFLSFFRDAPGLLGLAVGLASGLIGIGLALHTLAVILLGWNGDLIEARRRRRGPLMIIVTVTVIVQTTNFWLSRHGLALPWNDLGNAAIGAALVLAGCMIFLEGRSSFLNANTPPTPVPEPSVPRPVDAASLTRLSDFIDKQQGWRREGLTIGMVATEVGVPEHRLRRLINDHLGHRNFAAFVNAHRIEAAKVTLAAPEYGAVNIATIAYELGFSSLGPFNRAFRDATDMSPTEWRRQSGDRSQPTKLPNSSIARR